MDTEKNNCPICKYFSTCLPEESIRKVGTDRKQSVFEKFAWVKVAHASREETARIANSYKNGHTRITVMSLKSDRKENCVLYHYMWEDGFNTLQDEATFLKEFRYMPIIDPLDILTGNVSLQIYNQNKSDEEAT